MFPIVFPMLGKKFLVLLVAVFLLLFYPYLSFTDFESSDPLEYEDSTPDAHLPMKDSDRDGIADDWEFRYGLDPFNAADAHYDFDGDGLDNLNEYLRSTDPTDPDSDDDGMPDGWEVKYSLDPLYDKDAVVDLDRDGFDFGPYGDSGGYTPFTNLEEYNAGSNPYKNDTDGDGMPDAWEFHFGLNASDPGDANEDADNDGFDADRSGMLEPGETCTNFQEFLNLTDPRDNDTDGDGMPDGWEIHFGLQPRLRDADRDMDNDGLINILEYRNPTDSRIDDVDDTDPSDVDTDGDGLTDGEEVYGDGGVFGRDWSGMPTDPSDPDSDDDGMPDGWETNFTMGWLNRTGVRLFLDPLDPSDAFGDPDNDSYDIDGDSAIEPFERLHNLGEYENGSSPVLMDSDGDGMPDVWEAYHGLNVSDPSDAPGDMDNDGFSVRVNGEPVGTGHYTNLGEFIHGTDPSSVDTDGDGMYDGWEVHFGLDPLNASDAGDDPDLDGFDLDTDGTVNISESFTSLEEFLNFTFPLSRDTDGDGMWDAWEIHFGLDPLSASDAHGDPDDDGLSNRLEFNNTLAGNKSAAAAASDGILWSSPMNPDTDGDGICDGDELSESNGFVTDPSNPDTDHDYLPDGWELEGSAYPDPMQRFDPTDPSDATADYDGDSFDGNGDGWIDPTNKEYYSNYKEYLNGTDPRDPDSDGDGMPDGWEIYFRLDPLDPSDRLKDSDGDSLWNYEEYLNGTRPNIRDSDFDGLSDGEEVLDHRTDPTMEDTDSDGMPDGWEVKYGLDPLYNDANGNLDFDGIDMNGDQKISASEELTNLQEFEMKIDPSENDTDGDGMPDVWEVYYGEWEEGKFEFDPGWRGDGAMDPDGDGLDNYGEYSNPGYDSDGVGSTHPFLNDTDADGLFDGEECYGTGNNSGHLTDPTAADSDGDDMPDGWEIAYGLDPADPSDREGDPDGDEEWYDFNDNGERDEGETLLNYEEYDYGSDPFNWDTDGDDLSDVWEARYFD